MKHLLNAESIRMYNYIAVRDYKYARKTMQEDGITPNTIVLAQDASDALVLALHLYNPDDKGRNGKNKEATERIIRKLNNGVRWIYWGDFFAHKSGRADVGRNTEMKTGAGDWLYSLRHSDWDGIVNEYRHKHTLIRWETEFFVIECSWEELLDYLESYNAKGLTTWFKSNIGFNPMTSKSVVRMQEFKTSKRKIAFLQACPWNMQEGE